VIGSQLKRTVFLGLKSLWLHKLRSFLTTLGMVLGVGAVIIMVAFIEGTTQEAMDEIRRLGSTNIIIRSVKPPDSPQQAQGQSMVATYGLTYLDAERLASTLPSVEVTVPTRILRKTIQHADRATDGDMVGTVPWFPEVRQRTVERGRFLTSIDMYRHATVCVLEKPLAEKLFPFDDPIGKTVRMAEGYYMVVGIMARAARTAPAGAGTGGDEMQAYVPLTTLRSRQGELFVERRSGQMVAERVELHEITLRVKDLEDVLPTARVVENILAQTHPRKDYQINVPLERLQTARKLRRTFTLTMGAIAGVSLLVGGIGIMNIMLATITERTREIGIRRALGAKKRHIMIQFLSETVLLAGIGGLLGMALGLAAPPIVTMLTNQRTIVTLWSVIVAFSLSVLVGIASGLYPAYRAANMNPIEALRHE